MSTAHGRLQGASPSLHNEWTPGRPDTWLPAGFLRCPSASLQSLVSPRVTSTACVSSQHRQTLWSQITVTQRKLQKNTIMRSVYTKWKVLTELRLAWIHFNIIVIRYIHHTFQFVMVGPYPGYTRTNICCSTLILINEHEYEALSANIQLERERENYQETIWSFQWVEWVNIEVQHENFQTVFWSEWILIHVTFCTLRQYRDEAWSRDRDLLIFRMTSRVLYSAQYHRRYCTLHAFGQFGAQPRWQISGPTGNRIWYLQVTSPSRYEWAIGAGTAFVYVFYRGF